MKTDLGNSRGMDKIRDKWPDSYLENNIQNHLLHEEMQEPNTEWKGCLQLTLKILPSVCDSEQGIENKTDLSWNLDSSW